MPTKDQLEIAQAATLAELAGWATGAGEELNNATNTLEAIVPELNNATNTLEAIVPELFVRVNAAEIEAAAAKKLLAEHLEEHVDEELPEDPDDELEVPVEVDPPTVPATPHGELKAAEEYLLPFQSARTVSINPTMSPTDVVAAIGETTAFTRVLVEGSCGPIYLGGGYENKGTNGDRVVKGKGGQPLNNIEFRGTGPESRIRGVRSGSSYGGLGDNVRLVDMKLSPQQDGDFSAIRAMDEMAPESVLVMLNIDICHPDHWVGFKMGAKWSLHWHGGQLIADNLICDPTGEHAAYIRNMARYRIRNLRNRTRQYTDVNGITREFGMGRTLMQETDRIPGAYPKGGIPSSGLHEMVDCVGTAIGWEGMTGWVDADGVAHKGGKAGGGSVFTVHGHAGEETRIVDCTAVRPYCGGIAVWNEFGHKITPTPANPHKYRAWMRGVDGKVFNPTTLEGDQPLVGWASQMVTVEGYRHEDTGNRIPIQVSGTRRFSMTDARLMEPGMEGAGTPILEDSPAFRVNHWATSTPVEVVDIA